MGASSTNTAVGQLCRRAPKSCKIYARGARNGSRTHPERRLQGEHHWTHIYPERVAYGERQGSAKLGAYDVVAIRVRHKAGGISQRALAREFGVHQSLISLIIRGKKWKHLLEKDG